MRIIIVIFCLAFPGFAFSQNRICNIKGNVQHKDVKGRVYLEGTNGLVDSIELRNGVFQFKRDIENGVLEFARVVIHYEEGKREIDLGTLFFISEGTVSIVINSPLENVLVEKIKGPMLTMDFINKLQKPLLDANKVFNVGKEDYYAARTAEGSDTTRLREYMMQCMKNCYAIPKKYVLENPASLLCIRALEMMNTGDPTSDNPVKELRDLFDSISDKVKNSKAGYEYQV